MSQSIPNLVLYGGKQNRGGRAIWALEELGLSYQLNRLNLFQGEQRHPEFLALNAKGKVPTLLIYHDENQCEVITESLAILYTLAERFTDISLIPTTPHQRAQCHQWLAFGATELEPPVWIHAKHSFVYPEKRRVPEIFPSCLHDYKKATKILETSLQKEGPWICGANFSIADILIGHTLMWGRTRGLDCLGEQTQQYVDRLMARPAWRRAFVE